jgi:superfamily II DNA/RNA helicase
MKHFKKLPFKSSSYSKIHFEKNVFLKSDSSIKEKTKFLFPTIISDLKEFMKQEKDSQYHGFRVLFLSPTKESCFQFQKELEQFDSSISSHLNIGLYFFLKEKEEQVRK